jgi:hypothetical protein
VGDLVTTALEVIAALLICAGSAFITASMIGESLGAGAGMIVAGLILAGYVWVVESRA